MPAAGGGDRRPAAGSAAGLERRLAVRAGAVVAGDAEVHRHDPLAEQAVGQVAGDVGLGLARLGSSRQVASTARVSVRPSSRSRWRSSLVRGQRGARRARPARRAGRGRAGRLATCLPLAELGDERLGPLVPGALLELEAQAGHLLLEDPGALDVVGEDGPAVPVDVEQDRGAPRSRGRGRGRRREVNQATESARPSRTARRSRARRGTRRRGGASRRRRPGGRRAPARRGRRPGRPGRAASRCAAGRRRSASPGDGWRSPRWSARRRRRCCR